MDDETSVSSGHKLQGPHRDSWTELPPGFVPLFLVMQPTGLRIDVTRPEAIVGRHSRADVRLAFMEVSRRHCRLLFRDGHWRVQDLKSKNGIYVNGEPMHEAALHDGDQLQIGTFLLRVELGQAVAQHEKIQQIVNAIQS